jgi:hypothetical protein
LEILNYNHIAMDLNWLRSPPFDRRNSTLSVVTEKTELVISLAPEEQPIIQAAIELGDWLIAQFEMTDGQVAKIHRAQALLRKGVFPPSDEAYDYALDANGNGLGRSWGILFSSVELEVYSIYKPKSGYVEPGGIVNEAALWHMIDQEDEFIWKVGCLHDQPYDGSRWIDEVSCPEKYAAQGFELDVDMGWLVQTS